MAAKIVAENLVKEIEDIIEISGKKEGRVEFQRSLDQKLTFIASLDKNSPTADNLLNKLLDFPWHQPDTNYDLFPQFYLVDRIVEIVGIDSSQLIIIFAKEQMRLIRLRAESPDPNREMVLMHILLRMIVKKIINYESPFAKELSDFVFDRMSTKTNYIELNQLRAAIYYALLDKPRKNPDIQIEVNGKRNSLFCHNLLPIVQPGHVVVYNQAFLGMSLMAFQVLSANRSRIFSFLRKQIEDMESMFPHRYFQALILAGDPSDKEIKNLEEWYCSPDSSVWHHHGNFNYAIKDFIATVINCPLKKLLSEKLGYFILELLEKKSFQRWYGSWGYNSWEKLSPLMTLFSAKDNEKIYLQLLRLAKNETVKDQQLTAAARSIIANKH